MADLILTMTDAAAAGSADFVTLGDLRNEVYDATGKTTLKWARPLDTLINQWIAKLANLHNWTWREKYVELDTITNQAYIDLPTDFMQLTWLRTRASLLPVTPTTWDDLQLMRGNNSVVAGMGFVYVVRPGVQASASQAPGWRLELWPTPVTGTAAYFAAGYRRLLATLFDPAHVPDIPIAHHPFIRQFVRAEALRYDNQGDAFQLEWQQVAAMLPDHMAIDGQAQPSDGEIRGSVRKHLRWRPHHNGIGFAP